MKHLAFILLFVAQGVLAQAEAVISWTAPPTRENGTEFLASELGHYVLYRDGEHHAETKNTEYVVFVGGSYTIVAVDTGGLQSSPSRAVKVDFTQQSEPSPPIWTRWRWR